MRVGARVRPGGDRYPLPTSPVCSDCPAWARAGQGHRRVRPREGATPVHPAPAPPLSTVPERSAVARQGHLVATKTAVAQHQWTAVHCLGSAAAVSPPSAVRCLEVNPPLPCLPRRTVPTAARSVLTAGLVAAIPRRQAVPMCRWPPRRVGRRGACRWPGRSRLQQSRLADGAVGSVGPRHRRRRRWVSSFPRRRPHRVQRCSAGRRIVDLGTRSCSPPSCRFPPGST